MCSGRTSSDPANINNTYVYCGLLHGIPQRLDSGNSLSFDAGSHWSQPLYACASAVKATIKTTSFSYNGTSDTLSNLRVGKVADKTYVNQSSMPLWGVENTGNTDSMQQLNLIWGLVNSSYESHPNVSTVQQDRLYLPGFSLTTLDSKSPVDTLSLAWADDLGTDNNPGSEFYSFAMGSAYNVPAGSFSVATDYTGQASMAMWAIWQTLSKSAATASLIPNLIFTDVAAAAVVGTKGVLGPSNAAARNQVPIQVTAAAMRVRYHWLFAIPAFIVAATLLPITIIGIITLVLKRHTFSATRHHINSTSPGRIYTSVLYSEQAGIQGTTSEWSRHMGSKTVDLAEVYPGSDNKSAPIEEEGPAVVAGEVTVPNKQAVEGERLLVTASKNNRWPFSK